MNSFEKHMIGISFRGHKLKIGPLVGVLVKYKPDFWRRYSFLKLKSPDYLSKLELNKVVEITQKNITDFKVIKIEPSNMDRDLIELERKHTIELLNTQFKFWKNKIHIDTHYEVKRDKYMDGLKKFIPNNLKGKDLRYDKWLIANQCPKKPCVLANCYAQYLLNIALNDIKSVWGDFGNGLGADPKTIEFIKVNPRCPSIREREYI